MKHVKYKLNDHTVILDFPFSEAILLNNDSNRAENASLYLFDREQIEQAFQAKNFSDWYTIDYKTKSPTVNIQKKDNFLFKGNNLIVLYSILPVFQNDIKLIYIDPPYNTGNTFTYKDKFSRSLWLLFMKNRLSISREFLRDDGILVVQCDEKEQAYLKVLLDELYGEENFLGSITVLTNPSGRDYRSLARMHEYLLIYGKTPNAELNPQTIQKDFKLYDQIGGFELRNLRNGNVRFHKGNRPNLCYPFYVNPKNHDENGHYEISLQAHKGWIEVYPRVSQGVQTVWRWGKEKTLQNIHHDPQQSNLVARASKDQFLIFEKYRKQTRLARTIWDHKDFQTTKGTKHLKQIFGESVFDYPKPEYLIAKIIDLATNKGDRVMDFFLGSGTTASAAHKAGRLWIGIEQMDYIDSVTIPRLQAVCLGEQGGASICYDWQGGGKFHYTALIEDDEFPFYQNFSEKNSSNISKIFYSL